MPRILVAEPSAPISAALRKFLQGAADVQVAHYVDEAVQLLRARAPDVVIASVSGTFDGEALCAQVRKLAPTTVVVLVYPAEEERAAERALSQGADSFLVLPLKKPNVLATVRVVMKVRELREKIATLEQAALPVVQGKVPTAAGLNTADEAFFKKFLLLEVKRSKRYQYPVALLLVSLDGLDAFVAKEKSPEFQRATILAEALVAVASLIREVDLTLPFGDDKYLVFLPHTPRAGAQLVAERIVKRLAQMKAFDGGSVSVGVSCFDPKLAPKSSVSYGALVREASQALKKAQAAGGNRFEAAPPPAGAKRSRISLG